MALYMFRFKGIPIPGLNVRARSTRRTCHSRHVVVAREDAFPTPCKQFTHFDAYKTWLGKVNPRKRTVCTLVEAYGNRLPELVQRIKASHVSKIDQKMDPADVILSTVHKAKGLGFPCVFLCDDLLCPSLFPIIAALSLQNSLFESPFEWADTAGLLSDSRNLLAQTGVDVDEAVRLRDGAAPVVAL